MNQQHQQTLHTIRNILVTGGATDPNSIYGTGNTYNSGVVSPPRNTGGRPESPQLNDEELLLGMQIQRATSAPPVLDNILFASQSRYSHLFGDIRCEQNYESFYRSHQNPSKLPLPLDNDTFFMNWMNSGESQSPSNSSSHIGHQGLSHHEQQQQLIAKMNGLTLSPTRHEPNNNGWGMNGFSNNPMLDQQLNAQLAHQYLLAQQQQFQHAHQHQNIVHPQPIHGHQIPRVPSPFFGTQQPIQSATSPQGTNEQTLSYSSVLQQATTKSPQSVQTVTPQRLNDSSPLSQSSDEDESPTRSGASPSNAKEGKRINVAKFNTVQDAVGKIYRLAKDQYGCRFLQKKLEEEDKQDLQMIFEEVYEHIVELMTDPFGNYLCQKLVEHCNESQKMAIIRAVSNDIVTISMNMHGTRAVQKLIECLSSPQQIAAITEALKHHVVNLIKDLNGNHVIQRCLQKLTSTDKQFIYNTVAGRCVEVATHKHGCCVLQRCIDFASYEQKMMLVREIASNALYLVQNPFGNYVVQYVLDLNEEPINEMVISKFLGHISTLSTNKFSSNVMEKCLRIGSPFIRNAMVNEVIGLENLPHVLQDSYGNYVIQTALTVCDQRQFQQFNEVIRPLLHLVRNTPYGKKIESKLNKRPSNSSNTNSGSVSNGTTPSGSSGRGGRGTRAYQNRR